MKKYKVAWTEYHEEWIEAEDENHAKELAGQGDPYETFKSSDNHEILETEIYGKEIPDSMGVAHAEMENKNEE